MNRPLALAVACALTLGCADAALAQYALRAAVFAAGSTDAAGGPYALRATAGEPAVGSGSGGPYVIGQGFWYAAAPDPPPAGPPVDLTLTPTDPPPPVVIARGGTVRYRADFAIASNGPSQFQYWAEATLPNNQVRFLFGPVTVNGTPGTTVTLNLRQRVPRNVPLGDYVFRMKVGVYPGTVYDEDSFPATVTAGEALAARSAGRPPAPRARYDAAEDRAGVGRPAARRSGPAREAPAASTMQAAAEVPPGVARRLAEAPDAWLAWDEDGTILEAGVVQDLCLDALDVARREAASEEAGVDGAIAAAPAVSAAGDEGPAAFALAAPFPNPAASRAALRFALPEAGAVRLSVYDVTGRRVALVLDGAREAGWHEASFDASGFAAGVYVVRLEAGDVAAARRFVVAR
jgi:hypothetical protein